MLLYSYNTTATGRPLPACAAKKISVAPVDRSTQAWLVFSALQSWDSETLGSLPSAPSHDCPIAMLVRTRETVRQWELDIEQLWNSFARTCLEPLYGPNLILDCAHMGTTPCPALLCHGTRKRDLLSTKPCLLSQETILSGGTDCCKG